MRPNTTPVVPPVTPPVTPKVDASIKDNIAVRLQEKFQGKAAPIREKAVQYAADKAKPIVGEAANRFANGVVRGESMALHLCTLEHELMPEILLAYRVQEQRPPTGADRKHDKGQRPQ